VVALSVVRAPSRSSVGAWSIANLSSFYTANRDEFVSHAWQLLKDRPLAEEVVHEAFLKVILASPELESQEHARSYIHKTIRNLCIDMFRVQGRRPKLVSIEDVQGEVELIQSFAEEDFSDVITAAEDAAVVRQAIALLSKAERAALVLWEIEGMSASEIAHELGVKPSIVRHTISRARASLRRNLSEIVIDKDRGLTGLDLLSRSYKKAETAAKKHSKSATALILVLLSFVSLNQFSFQSVNQDFYRVQEPVGELTIPIPEYQSNIQEKSTVSSVSPSVLNKSKNNTLSDMKSLFPGLDISGVPTGFTVADSTGSLGSAYFRDRANSGASSYAGSGQILKTESGAANIFILQDVEFSGGVIEYNPLMSFGRGGEWVPLLVRVENTSVTRLKGGNFMFTVDVAVESVIETPIRIVASAKGRDLKEAPRRVLTRILLDERKSLILAQAVYVEEREVRV